MAFYITKVLLKDFEKGGYKAKNFRKNDEGFNGKRGFKKRDQDGDKPYFAKKKFQRDDERFEKKRDDRFNKRGDDFKKRERGDKFGANSPPGSFKWNDRSVKAYDNDRPKKQFPPGEKYKKFVKTPREQVFDIAKKEISAPLAEPSPEPTPTSQSFENPSPKRLTSDQMKQITDMRATQSLPVRVIAKTFSVSESTIRAVLRERPVREEVSYEVSTIQAETNKILNLLKLYANDSDHQHLHAIRGVAFEMTQFLEQFIKKSLQQQRIAARAPIPALPARADSTPDDVELERIEDDTPKQRVFKKFNKRDQ